MYLISGALRLLFVQYAKFAVETQQWISTQENDEMDPFIDTALNF